MSKPIARGGLSTLEKHSHPDAEHLHNTLPYRYFNDETGLFENQSSLGFGKKLNVLGGANDDLVVSLNDLVVSLNDLVVSLNDLVVSLNDLVCRLPEGDKWDYQLVLTGDNQVGHFIDANTPNASKRGGIVATMAENQAIYAHHAARHGFNTRLGKSCRFDLKNYQSYFFCTSKEKEAVVSDVKTTLEYGLSQTGLDHQPMTPSDMIDHVSQILNFNSSRNTPRQVVYNEDELLHKQMLELDSEFLIHRQYVESKCTFEHQKTPAHTRIVNFTLRKLPTEFRLYAFSNCSVIKKVRQCPAVSVSHQL